MPRLSKIGAAALGAFGWTSGSSISASYLVVAGGGGGGATRGGGGGAGGLLSGTTSLNPTLSYTVTVGAGGAGASASVGASGANSVFNAINATGGGGGAWQSTSTGVSGGSGGGGAYSSGSGGSGTSGQGFSGGSGSVSVTVSAGGGGGAGAVGANGVGGVSGGAGGVGLSNSITGTATFYAGGGGGSSETVAGGAGGNGGGGAGATNASTNAVSGTASTGGGGGGGYPNTGGNGGSGVVIISYLGAQQFGGGVVTSSGGYTIHTFNTSGTLTPLSLLSASYLIVAGGGGGGYDLAGGGGAGGLLSGSGTTIDTNSTYLVTVGSGGTGGVSGSSTGATGGSSAFSMVSTTAVGGGGGPTVRGTGVAGGSGGGAGGDVSSTGPWSGGAGTSGQGNAGGGSNSASISGGGGGGGKGAVGGTGTSSSGGAGGVGLANPITGSSAGQLVSGTYYLAGGGGGSGYSPNSVAGGAGGNGGGGAGNGGNTGTGTSGTANTGGGGGAGSGNGGLGGAGGSGIVVISYPGSTQSMAGGTVTISGGNVIHTFTSSGYLTPIKYVNNSLRFRASASAYLNRTPASASNRKTWTFSAWVKLGSLSTSLNFLYAYSADSDSGLCQLSMQSNQLRIQGYTASFLMISNAVYRDPAAWYHLVYKVDTTQATAANRIQVYVNGVEITSWSTNTPPPQNTDTAINNNVAHNIGRNTRNSNDYYDGYMAEVNLIDGQALTPNSFGTFNSYGVWQPITYGGSYGTNGFYLPFLSSSTSSYAGSFNGSSQYLTLPSSSQWALGTSGTVEAWIYLTSTGANSRVVGNTTSLSAIDLFINGSNQVVTNGGSGATTSSALSNNRWYHIALVYNSGNLTVYINGVAQAVTGTTTGYNITNTGALYIGEFSGGGSYYFPGYISNLRITNTAVYTSNFTPSATPLTAITGTALLTLQNATIVDNSTNAFTITNIGSVTTSVQYPFSYNVFNDQSPQGNNWTPNNISLINGSTCDSMTDVPTLTSATAANTCTLNPLRNTASGYGTFSNGNLKIAGTNGTINCQAAGTMAFSGKMYCEITIETRGSDSTTVGVGVVPISSNQISTANNMTTGIYYLVNGNKVVTGTNSAYGSSYTTGDVIGIAVDTAAETVIFYKQTGGTGSFVSQGSISGTGVISAGVLPYIGFQDSGSPVITCNFGQQPFNNSSIPTGYVALNTYNL